MALAVLDHDVEVLLQLLSRLPSNQLAIAITQHSNLSSIIVHALGLLAAASLNEPSSTSSSIINKNLQRQARVIADLTRKLIARGDPSLVNKLLPRSSLIDLSLCTNAKDILARLLDDTGAIECIEAASIAFQKSANAIDGSEEERISRIGRAAQLLARVVSALPINKVPEEKLTKGQRERGSVECDLICRSIASIRKVYEDFQSPNVDLTILKGKVNLLDAAWFLSDRLLLGAVRSSTQSSVTVMDNFLLSLCGTGDLYSGSIPLSDLPLAVDLALVKPVVKSMKEVIKSYTSSNLEMVESRSRNFNKNPHTSHNLEALGGSWAQVIASTQSTVIEDAVSDNLVDSILAVLPNLGHNRDELEKRLKGLQFADKDTGTIIQMLFDEEDDVMVDHHESEAEEDIEALRILQERANVFDEEALKGATVTRGKGRERDVDRFDLSSGLSNEIRAAILARAEQPDSDDDEGWNPFNGAVMEVGFEEEIEEGEEFTTEVANRRHSDGEDDEDEDEDEVEEGEGDGERGASGHGSGSSIIDSNKVEAERAAERILISAWSEKGQAFFTKEARKAATRAQLKAKLNDLPGKKWDDGLIESWATMFSRNPRKEKLLAAVDDIMLLGNQNIGGSESSGFGVNRGRGGRIMREPGEGGRGNGRGRGRGRGTSRGSRGRGDKRGKGPA